MCMCECSLLIFKLTWVGTKSKINQKWCSSMNDKDKEKKFKNIKCRIGSVLDKVNGKHLAGFIERRCLAVSRMAARASLFCQLMVEMLLEREATNESGNKNEEVIVEQDVAILECQMFTVGSFG